MLVYFVGLADEHEQELFNYSRIRNNAIVCLLVFRYPNQWLDHFLLLRKVSGHDYMIDADVFLLAKYCSIHF